MSIHSPKPVENVENSPRYALKSAFCPLVPVENTVENVDNIVDIPPYGGYTCNRSVMIVKGDTMMLKDHVGVYYFDKNYNCAESLLRAANDYYHLGLHDQDMILNAGFGAGMQAGLTCGALLSAISVLSMRYVEAKAHESADINPVVNRLLALFNEKLQSIMCADIKPRVFVEGKRCLATVEAACDALEEAIAAYGEDKALR